MFIWVMIKWVYTPIKLYLSMHLICVYFNSVNYTSIKLVKRRMHLVHLSIDTDYIFDGINT